MSHARRSSTYRPPSPADIGRAAERRSGVVPKRASSPPVAVPRAPRTPAMARPSVPPPVKTALASIPLKQRSASRRDADIAEVIELRRRPPRVAAPPAQPAVVVQGCIWLLGPSPDEEQDAPLPLVRTS